MAEDEERDAMGVALLLQ